LKISTRPCERVGSIDACRFARPKLFEASFRLRQPQLFNVTFNLIVETGGQSLGKSHPIAKWELHGLCRHFLKRSFHTQVPSSIAVLFFQSKAIGHPPSWGMKALSRGAGSKSLQRLPLF
jgi:hypothetical protein